MSELTLTIIALDSKDTVPQNARSVTACGAGGYLQVLPDHAPLLMRVLPGVIEVDVGKGQKPRRYRTEKGGYLRSHSNRVSLVLEDIGPAGTADMIEFDRSLDRVKEEWNAGFLTNEG